MSALHEVLQALHSVEDRLEDARRHLAHGRRSLHEAEAALARLDPDHPQTVVPPGLTRAGDQIEHTLTSVDHVSDALRNFATQL